MARFHPTPPLASRPPPRATLERDLPLGREGARLGFWQEHGWALLAYTLLSVLLMWPVMQGFTSLIVGEGQVPQHNLWIFWHVQQWLLGNEPLFHTRLLYYPQGSSLLSYGIGPGMGLLSLPFWPLGPEAAYNGALLLSLILTGYAMYCLARELSLPRHIAFFAGTVLLSCPIAMAGLLGHAETLFLAPIPLTLLALNRTLDPACRAGWAIGTAVGLLLALLTSGDQFVCATLSVGFFLLAAWSLAPRLWYRQLAERTLTLAASALLLVGPLLVQLQRAAANPALAVSSKEQALWPLYHPDLIQFFIPSFYSRLGGNAGWQIAQRFPDIAVGRETAVTLPWVGLLLTLFSLRHRGSHPVRWLLYTLGCVLFALGPLLKAFGRTTFTAYGLPILLPFAWLTELPGLGFMRSPGRFMMAGFVGIAVTSSLGLASLTHRFPRWRAPLVVGALVLLLLQNWPRLPYRFPLPATPPFYQQLAQDAAEYGVFDLPLTTEARPTFGWESDKLASFYQMFQMDHRKGIAGGYLARRYERHPLFDDLFTPYEAVSPDFRVNGVPVSRYANLPARLDEAGYRYVVWHKQVGPTLDISPAYTTTLSLVQSAFGGQPPLHEDEATVVYEVADTPAHPSLLFPADNWFPPEAGFRWAISPATVYVESPTAQRAGLQLTPAFLHDPQSVGELGLGRAGQLTIQVGDHFSTTLPVAVDQTTTVPLTLPAGQSVLSLSLQSGNFQTTAFGGTDETTRSFALRTLNLVTEGAPLPPAATLMEGAPSPDLRVEGSAQVGQSQAPTLWALHGPGWYPYESEHWGRWASEAAQLLVYSSVAQAVEFEMLPTLLHDPAAPGGLGSTGTLLLTTEGASTQSVRVTSYQPATLTVPLDAGWNTLTLTLEAGAFRPSELQAGADGRLLSFAIATINLVPVAP